MWVPPLPALFFYHYNERHKKADFGELVSSEPIEVSRAVIARSPISFWDDRAISVRLLRYAYNNRMFLRLIINVVQL